MMIHRDDNTISVCTLDAWVAREPRITYVRPTGGTVTLLRYDAALSSVDFCTRLLEEEGVLLMPGSALGVEGTVRIGFGNGTAVLKSGLEATSKFLARLPD